MSYKAAVRTSTVLVGSLFGVAVSAALVPALFLGVPGRFLSDWWHVVPNVALLSLMAALALPIVAGFVAALLGGDDTVRAGTGAGVVSTLVAGIAIALPSAGVHACGELLAVVGFARPDAHAVRDVSGPALLAAMWVPAAVGATLLLVGPVFGAIGAIGYDLWEGSPTRRVRQVHRSSVPIVALYVGVIALTVHCLWAAHLEVTLLPALGRPPGWVDRALLASPLLVSGLATAGLVSWALRDAVLLARSGARLFGTTWGAIALGGPAVMTIVVAAIHPNAFLSPSPWVAAIVVFVASIASLVGARSNDAELHELPRGLAELVGEGLLLGLVVVAQLTFVGGSAVLGTLVVAWPYVGAVVGLGSEVAGVPEGAVLRLFVLHWFALLSAMPLAGLYTVLAVPVWLVVRTLFARDR